MNASSPAASHAVAGADTRMWEERYDEILRLHGSALRRVARLYEFDPARQDDLFQEICLALWKALPRFRGEASERTFVFRIAHNRGLSHGWSRPPATADLQEIEGLTARTPDPETHSVRAQQRELLLAAVRALPAVSRETVSLSLEGLTHREIGEVLGISENNVAVRLSRARATLRERLAGSGPGE